MLKNKTNSFDMELHTISGERKQVVCFTKQRYYLFRKVNESQTEGVIIKKPRIQNDDISITDYAKVSISAVTQCVTKNLKITNIATVLGEAPLYNRFNIQATVSHVSDIDNHERDRNMMAVRTAVVQDKTGFATMTVFSQLTKDTADRKSYRFTNVNEDRYKKERVLKTTEMTKITSIEDLDVHI